MQDGEPGWAVFVQPAVAAAPTAGRGRPRGLHCMATAGATIVAPAQPRILAPEGYREFSSLRGGAMEVQDSAVVKFVSAGQEDAGLHTAVFTDPINNCSFPPITLFTAVQVLSNLTARRGCAGRARAGTAGGLRRRSLAPTASDGRPRVGGRSRPSG